MFSGCIYSYEDARRYSRRRQPRLIFDFIDGAAGREVSSFRNHARFDEIIFDTRVMSPFRGVDLSVNFLGDDYGLPFGVAPMGMCNLAWAGSDRHLSSSSRAHNIPFCVSSASSSTLESIREMCGETAWFQLYVSDLSTADEFVSRASSCGYTHLILTVDVPVLSRRLRDLRNGFVVPFRYGIRQLLDFGLHPFWSLSTLLSGVPRPANYGASGYDRQASRAGADWDYLDRLRELWTGKLIVKGVTSPSDAERVKSLGVDSIYVSNHGGRQLDGVIASIDALPQIRSAVGADYPLIFDSGIRNGEDIVKAFALGANFVMLGRPFLFALGAGGSSGLESYVGVLKSDIEVTLAQLGIDSIGSVTGSVLRGD